MENKTSILKINKLWKIGLGLLIIIIGYFAIRWVTYERKPLPGTNKNDSRVDIVQEPWLNYSPTQNHPEIGLIFYPGGRVDTHGYDPLMVEIAANGYLVVIPEMPINMAPFNPNVANKIINYYPEIRSWVIGGHSVGGVMAAQYTKQNPDKIQGLVMWASYPAGNADLSDFELPVTLIYGTLDPRVNDESISGRKELLPEHTIYIQIDGGGHHQFGSYQIKPEEHQAVIDPSLQKDQIIRGTLELLDLIAGDTVQ